MNKLILTLFLALSFLQTSAQTSVYHPFPDSNAVWNFHFHVSCPFGMEADYSIMIDGDTVFNNINYHKLFTPVIQLAIGSSPCYFIESQYRGAIREDTLLKKVFIVPKYLSVEELYFDFNWEVGDTVLGYLQEFSLMPDTINLIDSVLIGNSYRKRWFFNDCVPTSVIEGIGALYGLIEPYAGCVTDQPYFDLTCFKQNGQVLFPDTSTICDLITVSVPDVEYELQDLKIFPNPASGEINISLKLEKPTDVEMQLYNSLGQKIKEVLEEKLTTGQNKIDFSVEDIPEGVYYVKIYTNENEFTRKIIKY